MTFLEGPFLVLNVNANKLGERHYVPHAPRIEAV